jgi:hypothetical protein
MADGSQKQIDKLVAGDHVAYADPHTHKHGTTTVKALRKVHKQHTMHIHFEGGNSLETTASHGFYDAKTGKRHRADHFKKGDRMKTRHGSETISSIRKGTVTAVYRLIVDVPRLFLVGAAGLVTDVKPEFGDLGDIVEEVISAVETEVKGVGRPNIGPQAPKTNK